MSTCYCCLLVDMVLGAKGLRANFYAKCSKVAVHACRNTTALQTALPSATCGDRSLQLVPAWAAEWYFRSSLDRYVWIHGMLCALLHPWGERMLQRIDKLNLHTRLLVKTLIVAGELPSVGQACGSMLVSPSKGASICHASYLVCHQSQPG